MRNDVGRVRAGLVVVSAGRGRFVEAALSTVGRIAYAAVFGVLVFALAEAWK